MISGSPWDYAIPLSRSAAGFIAALLLAFAGDVMARVLSMSLGYPWSQEVHRDLNLVSIGVWAGIGAYLGWVNLNHHRALMAGLLLLVIAAAVLGVYVGRAVSPGIDPSYWWSRFATDTRVYLSAAIAGTMVASVIGLIDQVVSSRRLASRGRNSTTPVWRRDRPR